MPCRLDLHLFKVYGSCELGVKLVWFLKFTEGFDKGEVMSGNENVLVPLLRGKVNNCLEILH